VCKYDIDNVSSSPTLLDTNELVYLKFEKHTRGIGSKLLSHMEYTSGGLDKSGYHIFVPIGPKMRPLKERLEYGKTSLSDRSHYTIDLQKF